MMDGRDARDGQAPVHAACVPCNAEGVRELWVDGFRCRYQLSGLRDLRADPIVFLGGAFQAMASWKHFVAHFERHTRVLVVELPGTGTADPLPSHHGLEFLASSLSRIMTEAGIAQACVVAASYGSPIAWRFAQLFPGRVVRLLLAGVMRTIPADLRMRTWQSVELAEAGASDAFVRLVTDHLLCHDQPVERAPLIRRVLAGQLGRLDEADRARYVQNTRRLLHLAPLDLAHAPAMPTLVFTGEHDVYTRPADCREVAAAMPDALFTTIRRADHLFHLGRFGATLALIDAFHAHGALPASDDWTRPERFFTAVRPASDNRRFAA